MAVSDTKDAMKQFLKAGGWDFPVMMCPDEVAMAYEVQYIPAVFILDSNGQIAASPDGLVTADDLAELVEGL